MTELITTAKAVELLDRALEEKGAEYIYPRHRKGDLYCVYEHNNAPSCIVGYALSYVGLTPADLNALDQTGKQAGGSPIWNLTDILKANYGIVITEGASVVLSKAQAVQDFGHQWGVAVYRAKIEAKYYNDKDLD
jgi:hypothetical protein